MQQGFTLLELLLMMVLIALLAAVTFRWVHNNLWRGNAAVITHHTDELLQAGAAYYHLRCANWQPQFQHSVTTDELVQAGLLPSTGINRNPWGNAFSVVIDGLSRPVHISVSAKMNHLPGNDVKGLAALVNASVSGDEFIWQTIANQPRVKTHHSSWILNGNLQAFRHYFSDEKNVLPHQHLACLG